MRKLIDYIRRLFLKTATKRGGADIGDEEQRADSCGTCSHGICPGGCKGCGRFRNHDSGKAE